GYTGTFINLAVLLSSDIPPERFLQLCRDTERVLGAEVHSRGKDRSVDIDIILYGSMVIRTGQLILPHPRFSRRAFVVDPMMEICPSFPVPPEGTALSEYIRREKLLGWTRIVSSRYLIGRV
ncbi:MAG: 2-amino-4-hydroxy-6-hydroxymethyldihydropteridine diphosphokinase, partial [Candidatus Latescibacteria bacterium]|nr:2-amino-4-hydroxy-6-hydroxymethyldihydropteridine diphosphokinase [bacterium]MBD3423318.1 2-amino-4-hydroxy-6-hydroxymethyldihydropteridine diphosphokinase [Candidatus Latescibacterota bacterium]